MNRLKNTDDEMGSVYDFRYLQVDSSLFVMNLLHDIGECQKSTSNIEVNVHQIGEKKDCAILLNGQCL